MKQWWLIVGLLLLGDLVQAQQFTARFEQFSLNQGLSQSVVNSILQDRNGFMWFATADGLNRFDGYDFIKFRHDPQNPHSIADNYVMTLAQDVDGFIWAGTRGRGLSRFDPATQKFVHFAHIPDDNKSLSHNSIRAFHIDSKDAIWLGTYGGGLNRFSRQTGNFTHYRHQASSPNSLSNDKVVAIESDLQGNLWLATEDGLNRLGLATGTFKHYRKEASSHQSIVGNNISALEYDEQHNQLWIGTSEGLSKLDLNSNQFTTYRHQPDDPLSLSHNQVQSIFLDRQQQLWVGTVGGGLNRFNDKTGKFRHYRHHSAQPHNLPSDFVQSLYQDNQGHLWTGSFGQGVSRFDKQAERFGLVSKELSNPNTLHDNLIFSIYQSPEGLLWLGTEEGLRRYDEQTGKYRLFTHQPEDPQSLSNNRVYNIQPGSGNGLWITTNGGGLNWFDFASETFRHYRHSLTDPYSISDDRTWFILDDGEGIYWIATEGGGVNRFDSKTERFYRYRHHENESGSISSDNVFVLYKDPRQNLWLGTEGGLNRFDRQTGLFEAFRHSPGDPDSLSHDFVSAILDDGDKHLWVATFGGGLNRLDLTTGKFTHYREKDGLANDTINGLLRDEQGNLWISSNKGITKFNPKSQTFRNFDVNDGLQSNEFNLGAYFRSDKGELFFGGISGFNRFFPQNIVTDDFRPRVALTRLLLNNQVVSTSAGDPSFVIEKSINALEHLTLDHTQNQMSFDFSALSYRQSKKVRYGYKLQGWDDDWIYTDSKNRRATYTNLPSGHYTLLLKAANADGIWSDKPKALPLQILSAPWYSWQAWLSYAVLSIVAISALFRYRTRLIREKAKELEQHVAQRTETINQLLQYKDRMFANISHEFKTPLTLMLNPLQSLYQDAMPPEKEKLSMIRRNAHRLLRMIEQLLLLSKYEAQAPFQGYRYSVAQVLQVLTDSFQPMIDQKQQSLKVADFTDVELTTDKDALETILGNLLSNAIKYTPNGGDIGIEVDATPSQVSIKVSDSGIGIESTMQEEVFDRFTRANDMHHENTPGAGIGLALVKELVNGHKGTITLHSTPGKGSCFTVTLPVTATQVSEVIGTEAQGTIAQLEQTTMSATTHLPKQQVPSENDSKNTLLLIDDNPDMLTLLTDILSSHYHCLCADNGEDGLKLAQEYLPDLVVSDVMMPGISGHEVVKTLKQAELTCHIPVVMLTAKGDVQSRIKAWQYQADEYLDKPFDNEELISRIDNILSLRQLLQLRYQRELHQDKPPVDSVPGTDISHINSPFCHKVNDLLEQHFADNLFNSNKLAKALAMSPRQCARKVKSLYNLTPTELIRYFRLQKAAQLLTDGTLPSDVAYKVGFSSHSYFSQCFKLHFDEMPSAYRGKVEPL